jgi:hypothetical protein
LRSRSLVEAACGDIPARFVRPLVTDLPPDGRTAFVVRYRATEHRLPVESGFFVFVQWNVADGDRDEPELVGFV